MSPPGSKDVTRRTIVTTLQRTSESMSSPYPKMAMMPQTMPQTYPPGFTGVKNILAQAPANTAPTYTIPTYTAPAQTYTPQVVHMAPAPQPVYIAPQPVHYEPVYYEPHYEPHYEPEFWAPPPVVSN